jgi:hypothetical protein
MKTQLVSGSRASFYHETFHFSHPLEETLVKKDSPFWASWLWCWNSRGGSEEVSQPKVHIHVCVINLVFDTTISKLTFVCSHKKACPMDENVNFGSPKRYNLFQVRTLLRRYISTRETIEKGGPCWPLKLSQLGNLGVQMTEVLPWLVRWARHAGTRDYSPALPWLLYSRPSTKYFIPNCTLLYSNSFVPIAQQVGQAVVPGRQSFHTCLGLQPQNEEL